MKNDTQVLFEYDRKIGKTVAGMDEAGRGPLAGPVVAACVIMPLDTPILGIDDSKKVSESKREKLYEEIMRTALFVGVGMADAAEIDAVNILQATKNAMRRAYEKMGHAPELLLIDAVDLPLGCQILPIIKGDATSYNIAAASIVAKVTRDRLLREIDSTYPQYGFAKHKGYGTQAHIEALRTYGPCPYHRKTFITHFCDPQGAQDVEEG